MSIRIQRVVIMALIILTLIDSVFLSKYLIMHGQQTRLTTRVRLITFILCHCYFVVMLAVQYRVQERQMLQHVMIYKYSQWLMHTFVPIVALETLVEIIMFVALGPQHRHVLSKKGNHSPYTTHIPSEQQQILSLQIQQQIHIINFYFLIYMYSTILAILSALYMIVNKMIEGLERRRYDQLVNGIVENYVEQWDKGDERLKDKECSICQFGWIGQNQNQNSQVNNHDIHQNSINNNVEVVHLQCSHMFHKQCILQWVKKTYQQSLPTRCPNCRHLISI